MLKKLFLVVPFFLLAVFVSLQTSAQKLKINDSSYFEKAGVNVLVFSYEYNGMFFDEKTSAIGLIHHGVRTATGGGHTPSKHTRTMGPHTENDQQESR